MEIISAQVVLPMTDAPILNGAVAIEGATIVDVGTQAELLERYPQAQHEAFGEAFLLPGLINAHAHLDLTHFPTQNLLVSAESSKGQVAMARSKLDFISWLTEIIRYRKGLVEQNLADAIREGVERSLRSGTTCIGEISKLEGEFTILASFGIRAVLFPELISFDGDKAFDFFESAIGMLEKHGINPRLENSGSEAPANAVPYIHDDLISVGLSPHAPYTVSKPLLKIIRQYAEEAHCRVQIHVAESFQEMEFFFDAGGDIATKLFPLVGWNQFKPPCVRKTPIEYLESIDFLACHPSLVHCVQLSDGDIDRLIKYRCQVILCPRSNYFLGHGLPPIKRLFEKGVPLALGTDSLASNLSLSLWDEMRFLKDYLLAKGVDPAVLGAREILGFATLGGARVLGLEKQIGSLEKGKAADLVVVRRKTDAMHEHLLYDELLEQTHDTDVSLVLVNGRRQAMRGAVQNQNAPTLLEKVPSAGALSLTDLENLDS